MTVTGFFSPSRRRLRSSVRYEVALDCIGTLISACAETIAREEASASPNQVIIGALAMQQRKLCDAQTALDHRDSAAIETAISHYAPLARQCLIAPAR